MFSYFTRSYTKEFSILLISLKNIEMIKYNPKSWFSLIFALHKSDTMRILWKEIIYIAIFTNGVAYLVIEFGSHIESLSQLVAVYSLIGFVISLLLVFRTNTAYERWWEGRKKWGCLVKRHSKLRFKNR